LIKVFSLAIIVLLSSNSAIQRHAIEKVQKKAKKRPLPSGLPVFFQIPPNNKSGGRSLAPTHPAMIVITAACQVTVQIFAHFT